MKAKYSSPQPVQEQHHNAWEAPQSQPSRTQSPSQMSGVAKYGPIVEAPDDQRVEVPGYQTDPQELQGSLPDPNKDMKTFMRR